MRVSVIIPVLDDFERLRLCLQALSRQSWPSERMEVLVVDNGSQGDVRSAVDGVPSVRVLREAQPGSYAARNTGILNVQGDVLAFTDSDCLPEPDWIERGVRSIFELGPNVVVGGRVELFAKEAGRLTLAEEFDLATGFSQRCYVEEKHYAVTANLFTTPDVFRRVGFFNAKLKSGGDKEWGQRVHRKGVPICYADDAVVLHPARRSLRELLRKRARIVGGHYGIARERHPGWFAFPSVFVQSCLPPVRQAFDVRHNSMSSKVKRSWRSTLRVVGVSTTLRAYSAVELFRIQLGKPTER